MLAFGIAVVVNVCSGQRRGGMKWKTLMVLLFRPSALASVLGSLGPSRGWTPARDFGIIAPRILRELNVKLVELDKELVVEQDESSKVGRSPAGDGPPLEERCRTRCPSRGRGNNPIVVVVCLWKCFLSAAFACFRVRVLVMDE